MLFFQAVSRLQLIKNKFTPLEKLTVIVETFRDLNRVVTTSLGVRTYNWSMDELLPLFLYIVVRANILQLGAELHLLEDLMDAHFCQGEFGFMFTTLQAAYSQILRESMHSMA